MERPPLVPGVPKGASSPHLESNNYVEKKAPHMSFVTINIHLFIVCPGS